MKKIVVGLLILLIGAFGGYVILKKNGNEQRFKTEKATAGNIRSTVMATGTVNPVTTVLVGTQVSGTMKDIYVDFNSYVKKGQLLAQIDPATFEGQVQQARANLAAAEANVRKSAAALIEARRQRERNRELYSRRLIARSDLETSETNEMSAAAQVEASRAQVEQNRAALKVAETSLQYTRIISPVDGMVISRNVDVGQTVAASFQTPTLFNIAEDLSRMQIDTSVDEADIGKIRKGQKVEFAVDAYPDKIFRGTVSVIRNAPINVQNVVTYDVVVLVQNPGMILKPGMTANVSLIIKERKDVLQVPNAALRFRPADRSSAKASERKGPVVWILEADKPRRVSITTGISDGSSTEVVAGDLRQGDDVIVEAAEDARKRGSAFTRRFFH